MAIKHWMWLLPAALSLAPAARLPIAAEGTTQKTQWITGYWFSPPSWGNLPIADISFKSLTHIVHYSLLPAADGSFEPNSLKLISDYAADLVAAAHQNGVKVLLGLGQSQGRGDFLGASSPQNLQRFLTNIQALLDQYGYDGVDVDWETNFDLTEFQDLVNSLRTWLNLRDPPGLLTGAFYEATHLPTVWRAFDQINIMAYDGCSPRYGVTWHNAAVSDSLGRPNVMLWLSAFTAVVPAEKLGLGLPFYGYVWRGGQVTPGVGVTVPGQSWIAPPDFKSLPYNAIVNDPALWSDQYKQRDDQAGGVPYLSIDRGGTDTAFVTYDDEVSLTSKILVGKSLGLGGFMVYDLSGDYFPGAASMHPLLDSVATTVLYAWQPYRMTMLSAR